MRKPTHVIVVGAGVLAAALFQLTSELSTRLVSAGTPPPEWLPSGTSFDIRSLPDLVPDGGRWLLGIVLSLVLVGVLVYAGVRVVTRHGFDGVRSFLSIWMVVLLAAAVTCLATWPIVSSYGVSTVGTITLYRASYWGLATGWLVAGLVAVGSRDRAAP